MSAIATTTTNASPTLVAAPQRTLKTNKRIQLELLIREFQAKLGSNWDKYHEALTLYLVGKLSRPELVETIRPLMTNGLIKYHNRLLLLNYANSLQDSPVEFSSELASFWNKKNAKTKNVKSSQYEKFKQNIMGLPLKERRRIRSITKDSGRRDKLSASITLTRQALLPKIPMIQDKEQQQLQVNNLVKWQQDVVNGINTPLSTSCYELPDGDNLSRKVLMTMRENGLIGGINPRVLEVLSLGLEAHLKDILECAIDSVRYRANKYESNSILQSSFLAGEPLGNSMNNGANRKRAHPTLAKTQKRDVVISTEDMFNTFEMFPHLIEPCGPKLRLSNVMLQNDDMFDPDSCGYVLPERPATMTKRQQVSSPERGLINGHQRDSVKEDDAKPKESTDRNSVTGTVIAATKDQSHVGTTDELKWVLHDLISTV